MPRWIWLGAVLALSCTAGTGNDTSKTDTGGTDTGDTDIPTNPDEPWCAVEALFAANCYSCHSSEDDLGGFDMATDPEAMVGVTSAAFGAVLIAPGDAAGSLLYRKMAGIQSASEGGVMPPTGALAADRVALVESWINDGPSFVCTGTTEPTDTGTIEGPYHPSGWDDDDVHGLATKLQTETDCRTCHGEDLTGGSSGISCDSCHDSGWREDCTFCHGGSDNQTGAPPLDIDGESAIASISFPEHSSHVESTIHPAYDCTECHNKPIDVLTPGHLFDDDTPGTAEISFNGLSSGGTYTPVTCGSLYCHGDGDGGLGSQSSGDGPLQCTSCHSESGLSGRHDDHLEEGLDCDECHGDVSGFTITDPDSHVNGEVDVDLPSSITYSGGTCDGSCHFEFHNNRVW